MYKRIPFGDSGIAETLVGIAISLAYQPIVRRAKAVGSLQEKIGVQLLEWSENNRRLYITEPSFLFYLRWKEQKQRKSSVRELIKVLLDSMQSMDIYNNITFLASQESNSVEEEEIAGEEKLTTDT